MLNPPFTRLKREPGTAQRERVLLVRAIGILLVACSIPRVCGGLGELVISTFVNFDARLASPGFGGYPELFAKRLGDADWWPWAGRWFGGLVGMPVGLWLVLRRYQGARWGDRHE